MTDGVDAIKAEGDDIAAFGLQTCPACTEPMRQRLQPWLLYCAVCGLWRSRLSVEDRLQPSEALDETRRIAGLLPLRVANYRRTLALLARERALTDLRLLDVGCAYGWFLTAAREAGLAVAGVEPDEAIAALASEKGQVWVGYFPSAVPPGETFDVVAFNDVLEHLVDLDAALSGARRLLRTGGLLVVSAPNSEGVIFRLALLLSRLGHTRALDRLWQRGYSSPHLSYFNANSLARLGVRHGFAVRTWGRLQSLSLRGSWSRIHMDRRPSVGTVVSYLFLVGLTTVSRLLPSDQMVAVFAREGAAEPLASTRGSA